MTAKGIAREAPWDNCPSGVVSLLAMLQFFADGFLGMTQQLYAVETVLAVGPNPSAAVSVDLKTYVAERVDVIDALCLSCGLVSSSKKCKRILREMENGDLLRKGDLETAIKELRERIDDDMESEFFLYLEPSQAECYKNPLKDWDVCTGRFEATRQNVEESSKCYALERYCAAVFHILLVAEFGVIELAKLMGVEGDRPGWGSLERLQKILRRPFPDRSDLEKTHSKLIENVVPLAVVIKDSWRHKLTHVDNQIVWNDTDFSPQVAGEIISVTRGFMRRLARELP
jgi:hypothetical protein